MSVKEQVYALYRDILGETPERSINFWTRRIMEGSMTMEDLKLKLKGMEQLSVDTTENRDGGSSQSKQASTSPPSATAKPAKRSASDRVDLQKEYQARQEQKRRDQENSKAILVPERCIHGECQYNECRLRTAPLKYQEKWCMVADSAVIDLARCPMGLWVKNTEGRLF